MEVLEIGNTQKSYKHFPRHQHGCWEILLFTEGLGQLCLEEQIHHCHPGSIFILPPYTPHHTQSGEGLKDMSMFIQNFRPIGGEAFRCFQDDAEGSIAHLMEMAWRFSKSDTPYTRAAVNVMGDLVYQICVCYYNQTLTRDLRLESILELIQSQISNAGFDLAAAIQKTGYHQGYFRRIFKEATGLSPLAYLRHQRIQHAKSLFQQFGDSRTVKDIAFASGFTDPLYFSRTFRQLEGMSPTDYQRQCMARNRERDMTPIVLDTPLNYLDNH